MCALYADTDSIFLILKQGQSLDHLPIGKFLGQLTKELLDIGPNAYIIRFTAIGPKSYSYYVYNPDTNTFTQVSKCKGISQTAKNMEILNFENLKRLVDAKVTNPEEKIFLEFTNDKKIIRKKNFDVVSVKQKKKIQYTINKRHVLSNCICIPYGYMLS